jgi:monoterpene epsilon-lactone hydrolase
MSNTRLALGATATLVVLATMFSSKTAAQEATTSPERFIVPATVSPEAAAQLGKLYALRAHTPKRERPKTQADWDLDNARLANIAGPMSAAAANALHVSWTEDHLGGVPVLRVRPANYKPDGVIILYMHGGAYTFNSAANSLAIPALIGTATGHEVISIDYTLAPRADWHIVTDQVVAVWKAVLSSGVKPESIGMMGDSAGAGLAAGSVLKMRDRHLPLPGALYLLSPSVDLSGAGDTSTTLAPVDPVLAPDTSAWSREAYAAVTDQKNPYVSPVYGDYTQAFPPTLIQAGTREMLLSGAVREYQAIRSGGHEAVLDIYEGLPHDWFGLIPQAPETKTAVSRASDFFASHLGNGSK